MAGRADRLGFSEIGKAIILAETPVERTQRCQRYVLGVPEDVKSSFQQRDLPTWRSDRGLLELDPRGHEQDSCAGNRQASRYAVRVQGGLHFGVGHQRRVELRTDHSRNVCFSTLPDAFSGRASTNAMPRGTL